MRKKMRNQRGYTIVELLVVAGILSVLVLILSRVFLQTVELRLAAEADSALTQDVRFMFSRLAYDIARANTVVSPVGLGESGNRLILEIGSDTYTYELLGGSLILSDATNSGQLNSVGTVIENIEFIHLGSEGNRESVKVNVGFESKTQRVSGSVLRQLSTTVGLR